MQLIHLITDSLPTLYCVNFHSEYIETFLEKKLEFVTDSWVTDFSLCSEGGKSKRPISEKRDYLLTFCAYSFQSEFIEKLLHKDPSVRPSARDLLNSQLFLTTDQVKRTSIVTSLNQIVGYPSTRQHE